MKICKEYNENMRVGEKMESKEKEIDEKFYRVVRKKGNHTNTKVNSDGTISALQFADDNNELMGPLELLEVNEREYIQTGDKQNDSSYEITPRTWKQIVFEDIIVPAMRDTLDKFLDIGLQRFDVWMEEKAVPATKQKIKKAGKEMPIFFSAMKSAIKGEQAKALQIIEAEKNNKSVQVLDTVDSKQDKKKTKEKVEITQAEFEQLVALTKRSALMLVGCINFLKNSAISDMDETQKIEFEKQLKELTTDDLMTKINLLLEDKNKGILDSASYAILSAFRDGEFIIEGKRVPIEMCVNNGE